MATAAQHYYPLTNSPSTTDINNTQKEELYTYLATHKEDLKHHIINNSLVKSIHNIQMPLSTVITALKEQADFGAKLYKSLYKE